MADPDGKDGLNEEDFINCMRDLGLIPVTEESDCALKDHPFHDLKHPDKKKTFI